MKKSTNNTLRLAILAALAGGSGAAYAAFPASPVANEMPTSTTIRAVPRGFAATTAFTPTSVNPLQITVNLSNNTKFASIPIARCSTKVTSATAVQTARLATLSLGGNGSTQAVFSISTALSAQIKSCWVSATALTVTGTHASVTESITFKYGSLASSSVNGTMITWNSGLSAAPATTKTVTARVVSGFMKFTNGVTVATGGVVNWIGKAAVSANTGTIGKKSELGTFANTASITFAGGTTLAAAKAAGGVFVVAANGACTTASKLAGTSAKAGATSVTFSLTPAQVSAGFRSCFAFAGTTAIPAGSITAQLGGTAKSTYSLPTPAASTVLTVTRDGSSLSLMNMPRSTDTDAGYLRVYNTSSISGAITATIYDQAGTALATNCTLSSSLASNAALVMSAAEVETACGFTVPTSGRYRLDIAGAIPSMKGQVFVRSANVLTNVSADK